ncbi:MAG: deoxyuridine 5'-triphosphate nucleotidohydrolase [Lachnospiraceae bacterium]|nr:deoxyuridine 5'-triphosphate nucleotidohydrolase [Lachnospiraceae bacterium]
MEESVSVKIKYFSDKIQKIDYIGGVSDWVDLRAAKDIHLNKGEWALIPLGVGMKLPDGYEAHVVPRSSTFKNFGIIQTNHMGVIDGSYSGDEDEWFYPALAMRDTDIHVNDRICQFRIMKNQPKLIFEEVKSLDDNSRGGFGATGVN